MCNRIKKFGIKKKVCFSVIIILALFLVFAFTFPLEKYQDCKLNGNNGIARVPKAVDYKRGRLKELPKYNGNPRKMFQVDLRSYDLSELDVKNNLKDLTYASFDSKTKWPSTLPKGFDTNTIMEYGKNPGLNLRKLHEKGITGKGVSMAIIDGTLLTGHEEYKDN